MCSMPLILNAGCSQKEKSQKRHQRWVMRHREQRRAQLRKWYFKNKARIAAQYRVWQIANRAKRTEYNRKWLARKPGLAAAYARRWKMLNPEKHKESQQRSQLRRRDKIRAYMRKYAKQYYKRNRARIIKNTKTYAQTHPEIRSLCNKNWRLNHPDRERAHNKAQSVKRKARMRGADVRDKNVNSLIRSWRMANTFVCFYCGHRFSTQKLEVDHVLPIARGGKHSVSNICKSCPHCNHSKKTKLVRDLCVDGQQLMI